MSYIMKKEAFFWPLGGFFRWMGGFPIERKKGKDSLAQIKEHLDSRDNMFLAITPSGSRVATDSYKTGYLRMAQAFDIPLFLIGIHGPTKSLILDQLVDASGDIKTQNTSIKDYICLLYTSPSPRDRG